MTPYERALIRLKAFKMLKGWGVAPEGTNPNDPESMNLYRAWTLQERMKYAADVADWAGRPASDQG